MKSALKFPLMLVHYWFPVALGWSIVQVIHKATGLPILPSGFDLYLLGIWAAYSLDRLLDPSQEIIPRWLTTILWAGFLLSTVSGAMLVVQLGTQTISLIFLFSIIVIFYSKLKKVPFLKAVLVAIVWAWAGVSFPFQSRNWLVWQFWTIPTVLPLVLLIATSVILCDFKDVKSDSKQGVYSLPVILGMPNTIIFVSALLMIAGWISFQQGRMGLVVSSAVMIGLAQFPQILSQDALGPLLVDAVLTLPGLLILLHLA